MFSTEQKGSKKMREETRKELIQDMKDVLDLIQGYSFPHRIGSHKEAQEVFEIAKIAMLLNIWYRLGGIEASLDAMIP